MPTTAPLTILNATPLGVSPDGWVQFAPAVITAVVAIAALYANSRQFRRLTKNWEEDGRRWDSYLTRVEELWRRDSALTRQRYFVEDFTMWAKTVTQMTSENENRRRMMSAIGFGILQLGDEEVMYFALKMCGRIHPHCRFSELDRMRNIGLQRVFSRYDELTKARKQHPNFEAFLYGLEKKIENAGCTLTKQD